jgi:hypothetical protein
MSANEYPIYIQEILNDLNSSSSAPEVVLLSKADYINKDVMLYSIYVDLGYRPTTRGFENPLNIDRVRSLITDHYGADESYLSNTIKVETYNEEE